ncbi:MAG: hypothetical protein AABZ05_05935, partial [Nitrospirota bacterium]
MQPAPNIIILLITRPVSIYSKNIRFDDLGKNVEWRNTIDNLDPGNLFQSILHNHQGGGNMSPSKKTVPAKKQSTSKKKVSTKKQTSAIKQASAPETYVCYTCGRVSTSSGHLCAPIVTDKALSCEYCGKVVSNPRHICKPKAIEIAYHCEMCGRTATKKEELCMPK